ncbi:MAG: 23S rRNA (uracil(1939)-C(5))-methyltransferase RlmD [Thermodesulfobacteriota bacterium]
MDIKKGQTLELDVTGMAFGGKGLARPDGFTVFVDQAAPGDRVRALVTGKKKNYAEARLQEILRPSADRIHPPCVYSGHCGGCKWQFLNYEKQLAYKTGHVAEALTHIGLLKDPTVLPALPSRRIFGYRNKMEFSCSDRRWVLPFESEEEQSETDFAIGLHVPGTYHKVLDTKACLLQPDLGNQLLDFVRGRIKRSGLPVYGLRSHQGFWRFLMLRHSVAHDSWMVNIITAAEERKVLTPLADELIRAFPRVQAVVNNITTRKAGVATGEYEINLAGASVIREKLGALEFEISANSFFQTNTAGAETLYNQVKAYAGLTGRETVLDLYSGTGTIPIWLSGDAREVIGLEIVPSAVADAERNCGAHGIGNCRFIAGDIRESLCRITRAPDVMIIDPPRDGMHKDVVRQVLDMAPERIVYVSCNPATLARDLGLMKEVYRLSEVQPVDMFPHTYHIEAVAKLERIITN